MSDDASISIRTMSADDLPLGLRLREQAGWNQSEADWRRMLAISDGGCFVAELDGEAVGTVASFAFGPVAWIAMMLVDEAHRGRGIGARLMQEAIARCEASGAATIRLDATDLGRPVYEKLGFVAEYPLVRYVGVGRGGTQMFGGKVGPLKDGDFDELLVFDREISGCDRSAFLRALHQESDRAFLRYRDEQGIQGYLHHRPGQEARQLGPCLARNPRVGLSLFNMALAFCHGTALCMDVPESNEIACNWAIDQGLSAQRQLLRMRRGAEHGEQTEAIWTSSGPEKG